MAQVKHGDTVKVHYTGRLEDGTVFDSSLEDEPLEFTLGDGDLIPGFENAVIGMKPGESKTETIPADEAYGPRHDEMVVTVERERIPDDIEPYVGLQLQVEQDGGDRFPVVITEITTDSITLDANHPLAGKTLIFEIQLVELIEVA